MRWTRSPNQRHCGSLQTHLTTRTPNRVQGKVTAVEHACCAVQRTPRRAHGEAPVLHSLHTPRTAYSVPLAFARSLHSATPRHATHRTLRLRQNAAPHSAAHPLPQRALHPPPSPSRRNPKPRTRHRSHSPFSPLYTSRTTQLPTTRSVPPAMLRTPSPADSARAAPRSPTLEAPRRPKRTHTAKASHPKTPALPPLRRPIHLQSNTARIRTLMPHQNPHTTLSIRAMRRRLAYLVPYTAHLCQHLHARSPRMLNDARDSCHIACSRPDQAY